MLLIHMLYTSQSSVLTHLYLLAQKYLKNHTKICCHSPFYFVNIFTILFIPLYAKI